MNPASRLPWARRIDCVWERFCAGLVDECWVDWGVRLVSCDLLTVRFIIQIIGIKKLFNNLCDNMSSKPTKKKSNKPKKQTLSLGMSVNID